MDLENCNFSSARQKTAVNHEELANSARFQRQAIDCIRLFVFQLASFGQTEHGKYPNQLYKNHHQAVG